MSEQSVENNCKIHPAAWVCLVLAAFMLGGIAQFILSQNRRIENERHEQEIRKYTAYVESVRPVEEFEYWYKAYVVNVVDGDTVDVSLNLGVGVVKNERIRLAGINAPEMKNPPFGQDAKNFLSKMILTNNVIVATQGDKPDNYGRLLGTIFTSDGKNVNEAMIKNKHAVVY